jgi:hypothetical protein
LCIEDIARVEREITKEKKENDLLPASDMKEITEETGLEGALWDKKRNGKAKQTRINGLGNDR